MSSDWPEERLGSHVDLLTGFPFKSSGFASTDGVRLLRGDNVGQGVLRWNGAKRWPATHLDGLERYVLEEGDVIVAMDRPWIDAGLKYAQVSQGDVPSLLVQRVARLRSRESLDQTYLRYLIGSPDFTRHVLSVQTGTAVPHISAGQIGAFRFRLPPLDDQRRIAGVLGALDDKIEHNEQFASRLDRCAQELYEDLARRSESEGWRSASIGSVAEINARTLNGKSHPTEVEYIDISGTSPRRIRETTRYAWHDAPSRARRVVRSGDTLISTVRPERRSLAFIARTRPDLTASTGFAVLSPTGVAPTLLYRAATSDDAIAHFSSAATGSAYPAVHPDVIAAWEFVLPDDRGEALERMTRPLEDLRWRAFDENRTLVAVRDALLPKLVSGQLRVPESYDPGDAHGTVVEVAAPS
jgi:type I restriction enzyme S subunit